MNERKTLKGILGLVALSYLLHISSVILSIWNDGLINVPNTVGVWWSCLVWNSVSSIALIILLILIITEK